MDTQNLSIYIIRLKMLVAEKFGLSPCTPADFYRLSETIAASGAGYLSPSTLKRLWGYVKNSGARHLSTLDILARYIGYTDFSAFCRAVAPAISVESGYTAGDMLSVDTLPTGAEVEVSWLPDRLMTLRYIGNMTFDIISAVNTKLAAGAQVRCMQFVAGHPLLLDIVDEAGAGPMVYVVGKNNGIRWSLLNEVNAG